MIFDYKNFYGITFVIYLFIALLYHKKSERKLKEEIQESRTKIQKEISSITDPENFHTHCCPIFKFIYTHNTSFGLNCCLFVPRPTDTEFRFYN